MVEFMQLADTQLGMQRHLSSVTKNNPTLRKQRQQKWIDNGFVPAGEMPNNIPENVTDMQEETNNFSRVIDIANNIKPAFVMICGDLVNNLEQRDQKDAFLSVIERLDQGIPLKVVPGNHDVCPDFYNASPDALSEYRTVFGHDYYSFLVDETLFIGLNSEIFDSSDLLGNEYAIQMEFIRDTLISKEATDAQTICAFMHKPLFLEDPLDDGLHGQLKPAHRIELLDLLEKSGVELMLAGHLHHNREATYKNMQLVASGAVGYPISGSCGYRLVSISPETIAHEYYSL